MIEALLYMQTLMSVCYSMVAVLTTASTLEEGTGARVEMALPWKQTAGDVMVSR